MNTRIAYLQNEIPKIAEEIEDTRTEIINLEGKLEDLRDYLNQEENRLHDYESELFAITDGDMEKIKDQYYERIFTTVFPSNIVYLDLLEENPDIAKHHIKSALGR